MLIAEHADSAPAADNLRTSSTVHTFDLHQRQQAVSATGLISPCATALAVEITWEKNKVSMIRGHYQNGSFKLLLQDFFVLWH